MEIMKIILKRDDVRVSIELLRWNELSIRTVTYARYEFLD